jgi:hypothetical protein
MRSFLDGRHEMKRTLGAVFVLTLSVAGCQRESGRSLGAADDSLSRGRLRSEARIAPLLPASSELEPPAIPTRPIPQNLAAQAKVRAERYRRSRDELLDAYQRHGQRNILWDQAARESLDALAHFGVWPTYREAMESFGWYCSRVDRVGEDQVRAWKAARKALDAGCTDPLIQCAYARLSYGECAIQYVAVGKFWAAAADGMRQSQYPASMKAFVFARAGDSLARQNFNRTEEVPGAERLLSESLALLPAVAREREGKPDKSSLVYHLGAVLVEAFRLLPHSSLEVAHKRVAAALSADKPDRVAELLLSADTMCRLAWLLRGRSTANQVSADAWDRFDSLLERAESALTEAWDLDPTCEDIPRLMICVQNYLDRGRDQLELWFNRALQLNSDDYVACLAKLEYLEPRWHGSDAEMLAFGRACFETQNWDGRLPFILIEAHRRLFKNSLPPSPGASQIMNYFARPYVWKDVQAVYDTYLAKHPESRYDKTCYAWFASTGGHGDVANRLLDDLGPDWWHSVFSAMQYHTIRQEARGARTSPQPSRNEKRDPNHPRAEPLRAHPAS